jgi:hypothetical protein
MMHGGTIYHVIYHPFLSMFRTVNKKNSAGKAVLQWGVGRRRGRLCQVLEGSWMGHLIVLWLMAWAAAYEFGGSDLRVC